MNSICLSQPTKGVGGRAGGHYVEQRDGMRKPWIDRVVGGFRHIFIFLGAKAIFMACKFIQWSLKPSHEVSWQDDSFSIFHDF